MYLIAWDWLGEGWPYLIVDSLGYFFLDFSSNIEFNSFSYFNLLSRFEDYGYYGGGLISYDICVCWWGVGKGSGLLKKLSFELVFELVRTLGID